MIGWVLFSLDKTARSHVFSPAAKWLRGLFYNLAGNSSMAFGKNHEIFAIPAKMFYIGNSIVIRISLL